MKTVSQRFKIIGQLENFIFVDLSKAFATVFLERLLEKLEIVGEWGEAQ